jgi:hypothetical protein
VDSRESRSGESEKKNAEKEKQNPITQCTVGLEGLEDLG